MKGVTERISRYWKGCVWLEKRLSGARGGGAVNGGMMKRNSCSRRKNRHATTTSKEKREAVGAGNEKKVRK